jgi:hypothetical protein
MGQLIRVVQRLEGARGERREGGWLRPQCSLQISDDPISIFSCICLLREKDKIEIFLENYKSSIAVNVDDYETGWRQGSKSNTRRVDARAGKGW